MLLLKNGEKWKQDGLTLHTSISHFRHHQKARLCSQDKAEATSQLSVVKQKNLEQQGGKKSQERSLTMAS